MTPICRKILWLSAMLAMCNAAIAQIDSLAKKDSAISADTSVWKTTFKAGLFFSQQGYSNYYLGGGINALTFAHHLNLNFQYLRKNRSWDTRIAAGYGIIKVGKNAVEKNLDQFELDSKYRRKINQRINISALLNVQTKFHDIYALEQDGKRAKRIGNFLSPAYFNLGSGVDYINKDKSVSIYYTPINSKITLVKDKTLVPQFLPEKYREDAARYELGSLLRIELKGEIAKNISLHSISRFFTNHLEDFGTIDVQLDNEFNFKVNKFFSVNLMTSLVYDEDILFDIADDAGEVTHKGPRTQFKEVLNIGLSHTF